MRERGEKRAMANEGTSTYMEDTQDNRHLHLVRIREKKGIIRAVPAWIEAKEIRAASGDRSDCFVRGRVGGPLPARMEDVQSLGENIVVDETSVNREYPHHKDNVSAATFGISPAALPQVTNQALTRRTSRRSLRRSSGVMVSRRTIAEDKNNLLLRDSASPTDAHEGSCRAPPGR